MVMEKNFGGSKWWSRRGRIRERSGGEARWIRRPDFLREGILEFDDPPVAEDSRGSFGIVGETFLGQVGVRCGEEVQRFCLNHMGASPEMTRVVWSIRREQAAGLAEGLSGVSVLQKVNNSRWINKYFRAINSRLLVGGTFVGCAEVNGQRKRRLLRRFPQPLGTAYYCLDFLIHRIWPKIPLVNKAYFYLTRGHNRPLSVAEVLGRLVSCGFEIIEHRKIGNLLYFSVRKTRDADNVVSPTYGPLCGLRRVGRDGSLFKVYKLRTMHPYAEFLQEYIYKLNDIDEGGKFRDDFRVPAWGRWVRRLWLDEFPMLYNLLKGEMKLVGVRPLSIHYFGLYPKELRDRRIQHTPGLFPPFYADLPKTFDEIVSSEMRYLEAYEEAPVRTDARYFFLGVWNIVIKRARSA